MYITTNKFRIDYPYGIAKQNGKWMAFNREYMPLGYREDELGTNINYMNTPTPPNYENIPEDVLVELAGGHTVERNESGVIIKIFLYNDGTNPTNGRSEKDEARLFGIYETKFNKLSTYKISPNQLA